MILVIAAIILTITNSSASHNEDDEINNHLSILTGIHDLPRHFQRGHQDPLQVGHQYLQTSQ